MEILEDSLKSKVYGGILGHCIGDIMGVPVESSPRKRRTEDPVKEMRQYGTFRQPLGVWSDDSSLTFCLIDAYNNEFSIDAVMKNFVAYYKNAAFTPYGKMFDIGQTTMYAIWDYMSGTQPTKCGLTDNHCNGNGSLMRILPIAYMRQDLTPRKFIRLIEDVSSLTHGHKISKFACIFYVVLASYLLEGKEKMQAYDNTISFVKKYCESTYQHEFDVFHSILSKDILLYTLPEIRSTGYVVDTLESVIWTFFTNNEYEKTILAAVNLGGDTDTIAAIVGGIAGIHYGLSSIPDKWINNIVKKDDVFEMLDTFAETLAVKTTQKNKKTELDQEIDIIEL